MPPVTYLQEGCNHTIDIQVFDPDDNIILCRWGVGHECEGVCNDLAFPGAELDSDNCTISYEAIYGPGLRVAAVMIEDFVASSQTPLCSMAYQFVVSVYSSNAPCIPVPQFISPSITNNETCVAIASNDTLSIDLIVNSGSSGISITEIEIVAPIGVSKSELLRDGKSNFYRRTISWSPEGDDELSIHYFCYAANNSAGISSEKICLQLLPGVTPPSPLLETASPNGQLVDPLNTTWYIKFKSSIERPLTTAFITFHELKTGIQVYRINSALSSEVSFISDSEITIIPSFDFDEEKEFYINLGRGVAVGLEGCRPESEPVLGASFWSFETLDITPPYIYFDYDYYLNYTTDYCYYVYTYNLFSNGNYVYYYHLFSNGNISLRWVSSEVVTWQCSLNTTEQVLVVDCSNGSWRGVNLSDRYYDIHVVATDTAGNHDELYFRIEIDTIAPTANLTRVYCDEHICHFNIRCDHYERCIFQCVFIDYGFNETAFQCYFDTFLTLKGHTFFFSVTPIDCVGNIGQPVNYTWLLDFEQPTVFGVTNTSSLCTEDLSPHIIGQAQAIDNETEIASLTYTDHNTGCAVERTWRALDLAGNVGELVQHITLRSVVTFNFLPTLSIACDSTAVSIDIPTTTATVSNPCGRPLQLTYEDSATTYSCPTHFNRTWTLIDKCDQQTTMYTQIISLYNLCPSTACGRNETPSHGVCIHGSCYCNIPWYGDNCDTLILSPLLQPPEDAVLFESEYYTVTLLLEGTPPFTWTFGSAPYGMTLSPLTRQITWNNAEAGNHTITVKVTNQVDLDTISWMLYVKPAYMAVLDPVPETVFSMASPIYLTGYVEYFEGNVVQESLSGIVPVVIEVTSRYTREIYVYTQQNGTFAGIFYPALTEYGTYIAGAKHPSSTVATTQIGWDILGIAAHPQSVQLRNSTIEEFRGTFHNATVVTNVGPRALHGLNAFDLLGALEGLSIAINLTLSSVLEPGQSSYMSIEVQSAGSLHIIFPVKVGSEEGVLLFISVNLKITQIHPHLVASPESVNTRIVQGTNKILEFNITNEGSVPANGITALLPTTNYLTLMSFGNSHQQMNGGLTLESGESATLSILATVLPDQQLGDITGQIVLSAIETYLVIQFSLHVSSDILMNLTVVIEDEYTYFAEGGPLVEGAAVQLRNGNVHKTLTTGQEGTVTFVNILEDRYEILITGPNHIPVDRIVITSEEEAVYTVFIARRAVTYYFTVVPIAFEEVYSVTLEAEFETHVPIPVVTVTPREISLEPYELGLEDIIQYNITNHGLIRADDVRFELPDSHPSLKFTTSIESIGSIEPLSSVIVIVNVTQVQERKRRNLGSCANAVYYIVDLLFSYICGESQTRSASALLQGIAQDSNCDEIISSGNPPTKVIDIRIIERDITPTPTTSIIGPEPRGNIILPIISHQPYIAPTVVNCKKCITSFLSCFESLPLFKFSNCVHEDLNGDFSLNIENSLKWAYCGLDLPTSIRMGIKFLIETAIELSPARFTLAYFIPKLACFACAYYDCFLSGEQLQDSNEFKRSFGSLRNVESIVRDMSTAWYPAYTTILLSEEILGDSAWIGGVDDAAWVSERIYPILSDESDMGSLISQSELSHLLSFPPPEGATKEMVQKMTERLNNTFYKWNNGILEPTPGENMASYSLVVNYTHEINLFDGILKDKGYPSSFAAYNEVVEEFNAIEDFNEGGLCAIIRLQVNQDIALTREGFLAKIEIENKEISDLTEIELDIIITSTDSGTNSNDLFSISTESLSGSLVNGEGGWTLPSTSTGAAEWLIVPYSEAAPTKEITYYIGGTLLYSVNNDNISIPLLPTIITVAPDPFLAVHYFWEKYVIGDNPFTSEKEESVPFALGVVIHNAGYGEARNLHINSGQPEIIENEKGLLVTFKIISVHLGSESVIPTLAVDFGNLPANATRVARWWMISSLEGEFRNYSASFEYISPLGDPKLSVLDELEIHELVRNVVIYQDDENDGVLDFLVNDASDLFQYPDALYSSKTFTQYVVSIGDIDSVGKAETESFKLQVHAISNKSGWVYFRYDDIQNMFSDTERNLNITKYYYNETVELPPQNAWVSRELLSSALEQEQSILQLHILDYLEVAGDITYMLNPCTFDCPVDKQPFEIVLPPGKKIHNNN